MPSMIRVRYPKTTAVCPESIWSARNNQSLAQCFAVDCEWVYKLREERERERERERGREKKREGESERGRKRERNEEKYSDEEEKRKCKLGN